MCEFERGLSPSKVSSITLFLRMHPTDTPGVLLCRAGRKPTNVESGLLLNMTTTLLDWERSVVILLNSNAFSDWRKMFYVPWVETN